MLFRSGPFLLMPDAYGSWSLVEQVPLERYLQGVVPLEIGAGAPAAALAAQAVQTTTVSPNAAPFIPLFIATNHFAFS